MWLNIKVNNITEGHYLGVARLWGHCSIPFLGRRKIKMEKITLFVVITSVNIQYVYSTLHFSCAAV